MPIMVEYNTYLDWVADLNTRSGHELLGLPQQVQTNLNKIMDNKTFSDSTSTYAPYNILEDIVDIPLHQVFEDETDNIENIDDNRIAEVLENEGAYFLARIDNTVWALY